MIPINSIIKFKLLRKRAHHITYLKEKHIVNWEKFIRERMNRWKNIYTDYNPFTD